MASHEVPANVGALCEGLSTASVAFAKMLRRVHDPRVPAIGSWSIGETAAHASSSHRYFLACARGDVPEREEFDRIAESNARALADDPERDPQRLADRLEQGERGLVTYAQGVGGDPLVEPFAGIEVPLSTVLAIELGELLVHGYDIARAADLAWRIDPGLAALTLDGLWPLFPHIVDPQGAAGASVRLDLRIRHGSRRLLILEGGALSLGPPTDVRVDCHVSADPVSFLLLSYHRIPAWLPIVQGRLLSWGRRPWAGLLLQHLFTRV